ncbi:MAG: two-component regulator propeller domain-containing protein, partial [Bacteroidota bacterium]
MIFCLLVVLKGFGQTRVESEALTIEDGLSQGFVPAILQDREGFMWFGTKNGLNRYDGRQFEEFTHDPNDRYSIANDRVTSILEEGDFLLISTFGVELNLFHKKTKRFYRISLAVKGTQPFSIIGAIHKGNMGQYWINTGNQDHLLRVVFPEKFWTAFPQDTTLLEAIKIDMPLPGVNFYTTSSNPDILDFMVDPKAVRRIDLRTLETMVPGPDDPRTQFPYFKEILPGLGQYGNPSLGLGYKLCRLRNGNWETIPTDFSFLGDNYFDKGANRLWVQGAGSYNLLAYDLDQLLAVERINEQSATIIVENINNPILKIYPDRSGVLWVTTNGLGVRKISPRKLVIKNYFSGVSIAQRIYADRHGKLFFPPEKPLNAASDPNNLHPVYRFMLEFPVFKFAWLDEGEGQQWLGTIMLNPGEKYAIQLDHLQDGQPSKKLRIPLPVIWGGELTMLRGMDQMIYLFYSDHFIQYDPVSEVYQVFHSDVFPNIAPHTFYMAQTANGDFWIGTTQGLLRGQSKGEGFDFAIVKATQNKICASVLVDSKDRNILWIGTKGNGLARLDTRTMELDYRNTDNGLPNNVIYGVLDDAAGKLWL